MNLGSLLKFNLWCILQRVDLLLHPNYFGLFKVNKALINCIVIFIIYRVLINCILNIDFIKPSLITYDLI